MREDARPPRLVARVKQRPQPRRPCRRPVDRRVLRQLERVRAVVVGHVDLRDDVALRAASAGLKLERNLGSRDALLPGHASRHDVVGQGMSLQPRPAAGICPRKQGPAPLVLQRPLHLRPRLARQRQRGPLGRHHHEAGHLKVEAEHRLHLARVPRQRDRHQLGRPPAIDDGVECRLGLQHEQRARRRRRHQHRPHALHPLPRPTHWVPPSSLNLMRNDRSESVVPLGNGSSCR